MTRTVVSLFICIGFGAASASVLAAVEYKGKGLRDPFKSIVPPPEKPKPVENTVNLSSLQLQGVVIGGGEPRAIINGKIVKAGAKLSIGEVESISKDGVMVRHGEKTHLLTRKATKEKAK